MASIPEHDVLICLFHHTDRAERTVQELLELGIPGSAITLIGRARQTVDIDSGDASLNSLQVPDQDRQRLADGIRQGGSVVAVSADSNLAAQIESIFKEYSADKIDEKVLSSSSEVSGATMAGETYPTPSSDESFAREMESPLGESSISGRGDDFARGPYAPESIASVLLVSEPTVSTAGPTDVVTVEETLILLEPTDVGEDTDLIEPADDSAVATDREDARFDPDAPIDEVRNPMSDRLNDPLNRR